MSAVHKTPNYCCLVCGKKSKRNSDHIRHVKTHTSKISREKKPLMVLKERQARVRTNEEIDAIKTSIANAPEKIQKRMLNEIVKDFAYYTNKIKDNPISEAEAIDLIKDNNLSDKQVLKIFQFICN